MGGNEASERVGLIAGEIHRLITGGTFDLEADVADLFKALTMRFGDISITEMSKAFALSFVAFMEKPR